MVFQQTLINLSPACEKSDTGVQNKEQKQINDKRSQGIACRMGTGIYIHEKEDRSSHEYHNNDPPHHGDRKAEKSVSSKPGKLHTILFLNVNQNL
jgi:hypothetical protein